MNYTKERLIKENELSNSDHPINQKDVDLANIYKLAIEASRSEFAPKPGDKLIMKDGSKRHIDEVENEYLKRGKITIVENAYVPFTRLTVGDDRIRISLSTSGGPFSGIDCDKIEFSGKTQLATFGFFGSCGACANGQRTIQAKINIWREI